MKILLFLSTVWILINLTLSVLYTAEYTVGTIGIPGKPYIHRFDIKCYEHCEIWDFEVTLSKGDMTLSGFYGSGENKKFCQGQPKNVSTGIKKCRILQNYGLDKAVIKIDALEECHNVRLRVRGRNVWGISVNQKREVDIELGTLRKHFDTTYFIYCQGTCEIDQVTATLSRGGDVTLKGFYGDGENSTFCEGLPNDGTEIVKCELSKQTGLSKARIKIKADKDSHNVRLRVRGYRLYKISNKPPSAYEFDHVVGSIPENEAIFFWIYCKGPCEIDNVEATLSDGGDVNLIGFYGDGENSKFCEGLPNDGSKYEKCKMLKKKGLSKARIKIKADKESDNVHLFVRGYNLYKIYDLPPSKYEFDHVVGSIRVNMEQWLWITCRGPCEIEEVEASLNEGGDVNLIGFYGDGEGLKFCEGLPNDGSKYEKCKMLKKKGLSKARIKIKADKESDNVHLFVRGYNLYKIYDLPPSKYKIEYDVGSIQVNKELWLWITCRGDCELEEVEATLSDGGRVNLIGYFGDGANYIFCKGLNKYGTGIAKCKMSKKTGLLQARFKIDAYKESHNVSLIVRGYNVYEILDKRPYNYEIVYDIGSIHVNWPQRFWIQCRHSCAIEDVKVTFSWGNMTLSGLHGVGKNLIFCEGQKSSFSKVIHRYTKKCWISDNYDLKKPLIKMDALTECGFVHLIVKGLTVNGISDDNLQKVKYDIGTIGDSSQPNQHKYYIQCTGLYCEIEDVEVIHYSGFMTLTGLYGDGERSKFCEGQPRIYSNVLSKYIKKCRLLEKHWLVKAVIVIKSTTKCQDVSLTVSGRNVKSISITPIQEVKYLLGTIGTSWKEKTYYVYCPGPCKIEEVEATLRVGGEVILNGFYGDGENSKFCKGTVIGKCEMLKTTGLSKARIKIKANKESHNVLLIVRGYNLFKISDIPPSKYEVEYNVGSIPMGGFPTFWIRCRGPCEIEEVEATLSQNGDVQLYGRYGNSDSERFCESVPNDGTGIEKCSMLKRKRLARARVNIFCWQNCNGVLLTVRGYNLIEILDKPPPPINITTIVGTLEKDQDMKYTFKCKEGGCIFVYISVTFKTGGDVRTNGSIQNGVNSYFKNVATMKNPHIAPYTPKSCPEVISDADITLHGHKKSEEVILTVIGPYLESVDLETT